MAKSSGDVGNLDARSVIGFVSDKETKHTFADTVHIENISENAFLLRLSDALRAEPNPSAISDRAIRLLSERMQLDRCYVVVFHLAKDICEFPNQVHDVHLAPLPATVRLSDFPQGMQVLFERTLVSDDVSKMEGLSDQERAGFASLGLGALINATLRKGESNPIWAVAAATSAPRVWTAEEISLVEEVAERTWAARERAEAEIRLKVAHDTFRNLIDRSPFGTYIVDADFRFVQSSEGSQKAFGVLQTLIGHDFTEVVNAVWTEPFASEIIAHFRHTLATGEPFRAKTNAPRADVDATEAYDWKIERIVLPDERFGVICHFYDFTELQRQDEQINLLMAEVNHRAKNLLSLVEAIAQKTVETQPDRFLVVFSQRLRALAANQDLLVKGEWKAVELSELVRSHLACFADKHDDRISIEGPVLNISASVAQSLGMALHELVTNAAKFGALSNETGHVAIRWSTQSDAVGQAEFAMSWIETGGPPVAKPTRLGFGSTMIDSMLKMSLGCHVVLEFPPPGLVWRIGCRLDRLINGEAKPAELSHDTSASDEHAPEIGHRILVVDDEPLLATVLSLTLSAAGYTVVGPASSVASALALLAQQGCDVALLDVNLGNETSEPIARELLRLGKPFASLSGYSRDQLPIIMQTEPQLKKPVSADQLLAVVEKLTRSATAQLRYQV